MTSSSEISYEDKIGLMLDQLKFDEPFVIDEKVRPENRERFIQVIKNYIDKNFGHSDGFQIGFNNDYSKIRKDIYV